MTRRGLDTSPISWMRAFAVARVRVQRVLRTRLALASLVLTLTPWLLVDSASLVVRISSLAEFTLVGLTVIGAGVLSDDVDSGEYAIVLSHGCSPFDVLAGQSAASLGLTAILVLLQLPIALAGTATPGIIPLLSSIGWLAALLASWLGMLLLLATMLEGKANSVAMMGMLAIVPLLQSGSLGDHLPPAIAKLLRAGVQLLPQLQQATTMFAAVLGRVPAPASLRVVLLGSPILIFALASVRLYRLEPAGRLTQ